PLQEFSLFSAGTRISREVGGNLADMLDALADTMFKTMQTEGKIKSLTSQGKMQGIVMSGLPLLDDVRAQHPRTGADAPAVPQPAGLGGAGADRGDGIHGLHVHPQDHGHRRMNLDLIMLLGLVLVVGGTVVLIVWALAGLGWQMPEEDRGYLDPLPPLLRPIWPLVRFFSHYIGSRVPTVLLERAYQQIARAGANYMFTAEE
ncbi:hypothetical protein B1A_03088, partial [mine drainage metagenome]